MVLTFPHMGNVTLPAKALLDELKLDYILPRANTNRALEEGARIAPEGACLPLKVCLGTLLEACRAGADTILMVSGLGPCRFGYYCQMQQEILAEAGYPTRSIHLAPPQGKPGKLIAQITRVAGRPGLRLAATVARVVRITYQVDALERLYFYMQPREVHRGQADACYRAFQRDARAIKGAKAMLELIRETGIKISSIDHDEGRRPLRIGLVGEVYDVIDPFSSLYLQEKLGRMGVDVLRPVTLSAWIEHLPGNPMAIISRSKQAFIKAAKPYLKIAIGGHAQETLGFGALMARDGVDGLIQLYPMGCMPEIVAQAILPALSRREDIPVLTLVLDEMTAEAGLMTRVEAFLDLLQARRAGRVAGNHGMGAGC